MNYEQRDSLECFGQFISRHAHILANDPSQILPFAHNYAASGPVVARAAPLLGDRRWRDSPWIELIDRPPLLRRPAQLGTMVAHDGAITGLALAPDGKHAVSCGTDGILMVWDVTSRVALRRIENRDLEPFSGVALFGEPLMAATVDATGRLCLWDVQTGACLAARRAHRDGANAVAVQDGRVLTGGEDGAVRMWSTPGLGLRAVRTDHFGPVRSLAVGRDPERAYAASGGWDGRVWIWDLDSGRLVQSLVGTPVPVLGVALDLRRGRVVTCGGMPPGPTGKVPLDQRVSSAVRIWDLRTGACQCERFDHDLVARGGLALGIVASAIHAVGVAGDAGRAVTAGYDGNLIVWDVARGEPLNRIAAAERSILSVAVPASGTVCLSGSEEGAVQLWRLDGESHRDPIRAEPRAPLAEFVGSSQLRKRRRRPRLGRMGRGRPASLRARARLALANRKVRLWALAPAWLLALAATRVLLSGPDAIASSLYLAGLAWGFILFLEWRITLRDDLRLWRGHLLGDWGAVALALPVLPLLDVVDCPCCGRRLAGRRRLLSCRSCGWRD